MDQILRVVLLFQLSALSVCYATEIKDCFFMDYNPYYVQLVCGEFVQKDSCFSSNFVHSSYNYVRLLKTGNCRGTRLNETLPDIFQNLQTYDISFHGVDAITSDGLKFANLRILNASHNELPNLPGSIFIQTPQLFEVDFSFNNISEISTDGFKAASKLRTITLSHNKLSTLNSEAFVGLNELTKVDLSNNLIDSIERNTFQNNHKLEILHLENNLMNRVDCNVFYQFVSSIAMFVSWANIDELDANCMRGRSSLEIEFNSDKVIFRAMQRRSYLYPLPVIMGINGYFPLINQFNISGNRVQSVEEVIEKLGTSILNLDASQNFFTNNLLNGNIFRKLINLRQLNLSHTQVSMLNYDTFSNLDELVNLDLSGNTIRNLDEHLFRNNLKLKILYIENNPLTRVDCNILWPLKNSVLVRLTWDAVQELDTSCLRNSLRIDVDGQNEISFRVIGSNADLNCTKKHFRALKSIRLSGNHLRNTPQVIEELGSTIESLDISSNFVGELNGTVFGKLKQLHHLNLSSTQLSNFGFSTFYHQNQLKSLDISFNHIVKVDFTLLFRNFKNLETLSLEGNDLTNIDSVTRTHFPKLISLGISRNQFSCYYLAKFLLPWQNLHLFHNPSNGTHIDGVDCVHDDKAEVISSSTEQVKSVVMPSSRETSTNTQASLDTDSSAGNKMNLVKASSVDDSPNYVLQELCALKYLIIIVCCGYLVVKCKLVQRIKRKMERNSMESAVAFRHGQEDFYVLNAVQQSVNYDVSFHQVETITSEELNFKRLQCINASHNQLIIIKGSIFIHTHQIVELDFSFNKISAISSDDFEGAYDLTTIILSHNNLTTMEVGTFASLGQLMTLDLSHNLIQTIENEMFQENLQLHTLRLENNPMKRIDCNIFYRDTIGLDPNSIPISVHISLGNIKELNANCMNPSSSNTLAISFDEDIITFHQYNLPLHPNFNGELLQSTRWWNRMERSVLYAPNITYLNISGNEIQNTNQVTAQLNERIEVLDVSHNGFESNYLYDNTFQTLPNLNNLNLSDTDISYISDDTFTSLNNLRILDLSGNSIKVLDAYLPQWHKANTELIVHPTNQTNIDGIECSHDQHVSSEHTTTEAADKEKVWT
ncbi:protein artichoke-like [Sitodiplosis mosellana]|uniref:protein artichoke-like n=1 Tax=Sitodiplosis mosellana TaxID=263140 RepID=UPI0024438274|nr:protein artichoke-like [Sitodiplosis mosellana]